MPAHLASTLSALLQRIYARRRTDQCLNFEGEARGAHRAPSPPQTAQTAQRRQDGSRGTGHRHRPGHNLLVSCRAALLLLCGPDAVHDVREGPPRCGSTA